MRVDLIALGTFLEREIGPQAKETLVTVAKQLIEERRLLGRQEGRQEGRHEGRHEGHHEGAERLLLRQLRQRFGTQVDLHIEQRLAAASTEQLEIWSLRILSAPSLGALFAD